MYYSISTAKFAKKEGNFDIMGVEGNTIYIETNYKVLDKDFEEVKSIPSKFIPDLDLLKRQKKEELESARLKANTQSIEYKGYKIQATQEDKTLISDAVNLYSSLGGVPEGTTWITEDNQFLSVTLEDLVNIMALIGKNTNDSFVKCRLLKNKVNEAKTVKEIQAIKWDE